VGLATANVIACTSENFRVITASRSLVKVKNAMSGTQAAGTKGPLSTVQLDITDERLIEQAVTFVHEKFG